jgi:hypothetical protein
MSKDQFKTWGWYKTYQISEFHYNKITLEDSYPKSMSDDECIDDLEKRIEAQARRKYPHIFANKNDSRIEIYGLPYGVTEPSPPPIVIEKEAPEENISLLDRINNSTNTKELKSWELLIKVEKDAKKKSELQSAYDKKMDELKNRPAHETK